MELLHFVSEESGLGWRIRERERERERERYFNTEKKKINCLDKVLHFLHCICLFPSFLPKVSYHVRIPLSKHRLGDIYLYIYI